MGAAESMEGARAESIAPSSTTEKGGEDEQHYRLEREPESLAGGQAELRAAVAALIASVGGPWPGVEDRGGIELEVSPVVVLVDRSIERLIDRLTRSRLPINRLAMPRPLAIASINGSSQPPLYQTTRHHQVPFVAQEGTWDCGVACVQMALAYAQQHQPRQAHQPPPASLTDDEQAGGGRHARQPSQPPPADQTKDEEKEEKEEEEEEDVTRAALLARVGTESIWTVDLLFLLQVGGFVGACIAAAGCRFRGGKRPIDRPLSTTMSGTQGYMARHHDRAVFFATTAPGVCLQYSQVRASVFFSGGIEACGG